MPRVDANSGFDLAMKIMTFLMIAFGVFTHGNLFGGIPTVALLLIAVGLFGIPHGAFDYAVAKKEGLISTRRSAVLFLGAYLCLAAGSFFLWMVLPVVGLTLFLTLSVWHFSHDWQARGGLFRSAMALLVVFGPLVFWPQLVLGYFDVLLFGQLPTVSPDALKIFGGLLAALCILACGIKLLKRQWHDLLEGVLLLAGVVLYEPLIFFVIYFCGLHSVRSLAQLRVRLGGAGISFLLQGLLPSVLTYGLGMGAYFLLPAVDSDTGALRVIFIGLFALTVPHLLLDTWIDVLRASSGRKCSDDMVATISV